MASHNQNEEMTLDTKRLTAGEIFQAAVESARGEVHRSIPMLAFSGVAGGITMGLTALGVASIRGFLGVGGWRELISFLAYPLGFVAVIIGRSQLFTENTLYPVVLVLDERRYFVRTLQLWAVVFCANVFGAWVFALLATRTAALHQETLAQLVQLGLEGASGGSAHFFWSGVIGGWLIALVAWTVTASHWTIGQLMMIYLITFVVGVGRFSHCIAGSCELLSAVEVGSLSVGSYFHWLGWATLGNVCGGVFIVSLLNYGQVRAS